MAVLNTNDCFVLFDRVNLRGIRVRLAVLEEHSEAAVRRKVIVCRKATRKVCNFICVELEQEISKSPIREGGARKVPVPRCGGQKAIDVGRCIAIREDKERGQLCCQLWLWRRDTHPGIRIRPRLRQDCGWCNSRRCKQCIPERTCILVAVILALGQRLGKNDIQLGWQSKSQVADMYWLGVIDHAFPRKWVAGFLNHKGSATSHHFVDNNPNRPQV